MTVIKHQSLHFALSQECPLQIAGVINAYCAQLAQRAGFKALYLSGAGVANACFAIPDTGLTYFKDIFIEAKRITQSCNLPLIVDLDTGFEQQITAQSIIKQFQDINVAAIQIEDQVVQKRCGHLQGKKLVSITEMQNRLLAFINIKSTSRLLIMARTDAYSVEGFDATVKRVLAYQSIGVDFIFVESLKSLNEYKKITNAVNIPVLANITEFGQTPLFTINELAETNIAMALYPLTAFRAMNQAAFEIYKTIKKNGTQKDIVDKLQSRAELYEILKYNPND